MSTAKDYKKAIYWFLAADIFNMNLTGFWYFNSISINRFHFPFIHFYDIEINLTDLFRNIFSIFVITAIIKLSSLKL